MMPRILIATPRNNTTSAVGELQLVLLIVGFESTETFVGDVEDTSRGTRVCKYGKTGMV